MKFLVTCLMAFLVGTLLAQTQNRDSVATDGEIRLSPQFLRELDNAFSLGPVEAPIVVPDTTLSVAQLHEWVGEPDPNVGVPQGGYKQRFDSTYFALKLYMKEFCRWDPPQEIQIPGLGLTGPSSAPREGVGHTFRVDVNALAKYIRPKERRLYKSRKLADEHRAAMDGAFPMGER